MGSLFPGVVLSCRFWRERPAAAPMERRVVREARRAASWSAWLQLICLEAEEQQVTAA
jgi:hypothetical protein